MRKVNDSRGTEGRDEMKKAFEFMLGHIGAFFILEACCFLSVYLNVVDYRVYCSGVNFFKGDVILDMLTRIMWM